MENFIGPSGAEAFAEALKENSSITYLDLSGNQFGDRGSVIARFGSRTSKKQLIDIDGKNIIIKGKSGHLFGAHYLAGDFSKKYSQSKLLRYRKDEKKPFVFFFNE